MNELMINWLNKRKDDGYCVCGCAMKHAFGAYYFKSGHLLWFVNEQHRERWAKTHAPEQLVLPFPLSAP